MVFCCLIIVFGYLFVTNWRIAFVGFSFLAVTVLYTIWTVPFHSVIPTAVQSFTGRIAGDPLFDGDTVSFPFKTQWGENVRVTGTFNSLSDKETAMKNDMNGSACTISGSLAVPEPPGNLHGFPYSEWLQSQQIFKLLRPSKPPDCHPYPLSIIDHIRLSRQKYIKAIGLKFPGPAGEMMTALIFGDRTELDPTVLQSFQTLGLIHLLAISGLHLNLLFGFLYVVFLRSGLSKERVTQLIFLIIPLYMVLTGLSPSVLRAGVMMLIFFSARLFNWRLSSLESLSVSCLLLLFINPLNLVTLGFQLSYLVSFAIILSAGWIKKYRMSFFLRILMISLISEAVTMPVLLHSFYDFSLLSPFANFVFVPMVTLVILPLSFLTFFSSFLLPFLSHFFFLMDQTILTPVLTVITIAAQIDFTRLRFGALPSWVLVTLGIAMIPIFVMWEKTKPRTSFVILSALLILPYCIVIAVRHADSKGYVAFLNVGQGDSTLIELPHQNLSMLIDTGGTIPIPGPKWKERKQPYDVGVAVVYHELQAMGIKKLNYLILTHRDYDHIGGAEGLLKHMKVDYLVINQHFMIGNREKRLFELAKKKGTVILVVNNYVKKQLAGFPFEFISVAGGNLSSNNGSLVVKTTLGGEKWLFTGDLEQEGEDQLLNEGIDLQTDILKVGHHGSKTSTGKEWLKALHPELAIISVGKHNRYGHPNQEVLTRLKNADIPVLRTDIKGEIEFSFTRHDLIQVKTAK